MNPRIVDVLLIPEVMALDVAGPLDVLTTANRFIEPSAPRYEIRPWAVFETTAVASCGLTLAAPSLAGRNTAGHTLLVPGGSNAAIERLLGDARMSDWLRQHAGEYERVVSICNGALMLAGAGLLDGIPATTHWGDTRRLRELAGEAQVVDDALFVEYDGIFTSAGVAAGIDLMLHLVERDHGAGVALAVARHLVVYLRRPGGQRQFSEILRAEFESGAMPGFSDWLLENLSRDITLDDMAAAAGMSRRNFSRRFREMSGITPMQHLERIRIEMAARMLCDSQLALKAIARRNGYGSVQSLRRQFGHHFGVSPSEYREHFRSAGRA